MGVYEPVGQVSRTGPAFSGYIITLMFVILVNIHGTVGTCDLTDCWNLYQLSQESLGVRDDFPLRPHPQYTLPPTELRARCLALRTFYLCLRNMTFSCRSELSFHGAYKGIEKQLGQLNCSINGPVFDPKDIPNPTEGPGVKCSYSKPLVSGASDEQSNVEYYYCDLFGDPHLRTFAGEYQTCRLEGAWPLLDNEYLTVQVTNHRVGMLDTATAITEITVIVKQYKKCAGDTFVMYQAVGGDLPNTFTNYRKHLGQDSSVSISEVVASQHIEIKLRYIDTVVVIRQVGQYYSVAIKMPSQVVNDTLWLEEDGHEDEISLIAAPVQLCAFGCPPNQQIPYKEIITGAQLLTSSPNGKGSSQNSDSSPLTGQATIVLPREKALQKCRRARVTDFYLDSCVFDLMLTGDTNFTLTSSYALQDSLRLVPELAVSYRNRTDLEAPAAGSSHSTNGASSLTSTVFFTVYTFYSIVYQSHLNYIHRTSFILMLSVLPWLLQALRYR